MVLVLSLVLSQYCAPGSLGGQPSGAVTRVSGALSLTAVTINPGDLVLYPDAGVNSGLCWGQDYDGTNTCIGRVAANEIQFNANGVMQMRLSASAILLEPNTSGTGTIDLQGRILNNDGSTPVEFNDSFGVRSLGQATGSLAACGAATAGAWDYDTTLTRMTMCAGTTQRRYFETVIQTAPSISSGFGTTPSIAGLNPRAFRVTVGTGGTASTGVVTLPAAATAWNCFASDQTTPGANDTKQSASSTTSVTLTNYVTTTGVAGAWTAGDVLVVHCYDY